MHDVLQHCSYQQGYDYLIEKIFKCRICSQESKRMHCIACSQICAQGSYYIILLHDSTTDEATYKYHACQQSGVTNWGFFERFRKTQGAKLKPFFKTQGSKLKVFPENSMYRRFFNDFFKKSLNNLRYIEFSGINLSFEP